MKTVYLFPDIKTFLFVRKNKLNIFDFNRYLTNKFHETALEETKVYRNNKI